jgi:hypothetical protein
MIRKIIITVLSSLIALSSFGQIMNDSTVQVVGYWNKGDRQTYNISTEKYKVKDADTTAREVFTYSVDVTVKDSTENSYIIEWYYYNMDYKSEDGEDYQLMKDVLSLTQNLTVTVKTDEFGAFQEVVNWKDIRDYLQKTTKQLTKKYKKDKLFAKMFTQVMDMYKTKEAIETSAIDEVHQFYAFHGGKYTLGEEITGKMQMPNMYGGTPFDADFTLWLQEVDTEEESYILVQQQTVDSEQLKQVTFDFLTDLAKSVKAPAENMPKMSDTPSIGNTSSIVSSIHDSGWVVYSVYIKEISVGDQATVEETTIELVVQE